MTLTMATAVLLAATCFASPPVFAIRSPALASGLGSARGMRARAPSPQSHAARARVKLLAGPSLAELHALSARIRPEHYFGYLMLAGIGIPVSEDGLVLLAGSLLASFPPARRVATVLAIYLGVVLSDGETFFLGRWARARGQKLGPVLSRLIGVPPAPSSAEPGLEGSADAADAAAPAPGARRGKSGQAQELIRRSGGYVGFVARFCVGLRGAIALLCGASLSVSGAQYVGGAAVGALLTVPIQLAVGACVRERIATPVGLASIVASLYCIGPAVATVASAVAGVAAVRRRRRESESAAELGPDGAEG